MKALQDKLEQHHKGKVSAKYDRKLRKEVLSTNQLLAYMIKGFNNWVTGDKTKLVVDVTEDFPQFVAPMQEAAE